MKRLLLFFFLISGASLSAQWSVGVKSQMGKSWQEYGDDFFVNGFDLPITHYGFSVELMYQLSPRFQLGIAPGFARRGAACEPGFVLNNPFLIADATLYTNNAQLPFMLRYQQPILRKLNLFAQAGGGPSYIISGFRDIDFVTPETPATREQIVFSDEPGTQRLDLGAYGGIGFGYYIGLGTIRLSGDYYHGFINNTDTDNFTTLNRTWSVGLGYSLQL